MEIEIISFAKRGASLSQTAEDEYAKRLKRFCKLKLQTLTSSSGNQSPQVIQRSDSERALEKVSSTRFLVVLDPIGTQYTSPQFAAFLQKRMSSGAADTTFAIGGAYGWDDRIRSRAQLVLSLSKLTFPHLLARLILLEQVYRGFASINGIPYHKE